MSRCKACDSVMKQSEMFTREVSVGNKTIHVDEDLCAKCKKIIMGEYEDDADVIESLALDILQSDWDDYYE